MKNPNKPERQKHAFVFSINHSLGDLFIVLLDRLRALG
jgi:phosphopantetheinyl transferase